MYTLKNFKLKNIFLLTAILFMLPLHFALAEEPQIHPTGYVPSTLDWSHLENNPPETGRLSTTSSLPASYDLRTLGRVPSTVRNQVRTQACWAFAAAGAMESSYMTKYPNETPDFSELHLAWFTYKDPKKGNSFPVDDGEQILNQGGNSDRATAFASRMSGLVNETSLPYLAPDVPDDSVDIVASQQIGNKAPEDYFPLAMKLRERIDVGVINKNNRDFVKQYIAAYGAMSIGFYIDQEYDAQTGKYKFISSSNAYYCKDHGKDIDHGVVIVGWDDNFSKKKFADQKPKSNGAWLARNSWGSSWGDSGYFWISYEQYMTSGTIFVVDKPVPNEKVYFHDALGMVATYGYGKNTPAYAANVFRAESNELITSAGFYTTDNNAQYEVYVCSDLGTTKPSSPLSGDAVLVTSGTFANAGYHVVDFPESVLVTKKHYFSVILKVTNPASKKPIAVEHIKPILDEGAVVVNKKESYFSSDMISWKDGTKFTYKKNACIKAFTIPFTKIAITEKNFPDENFRRRVSGYDSNHDGYLETQEIYRVTHMDISFWDIADLKGIEYFKALQVLDCRNRNNHLTKLDVSKCSALQVLNCSYNKLTKLDVSKCSVLRELNCSYNQLKTLTLGENNSLQVLDCQRNQLTKLDVSKCSVLRELNCSYNQLKTLTFGENNSLQVLDCQDNHLTKLDVSKCSALQELICPFNQLKTLTLGKNNSLLSLACLYNQLTKLDVSKCSALQGLGCQFNQLTKLDVSKCSALQWLSCFENQLETLTLGKNNSLQKLWCYNNQLTKLDVSKCSALQVLYCYSNQLTKLDVSKCSALQELQCWENQLKTLTLGENNSLLYIECRDNQLTKLDVSKCSALQWLSCFENQLKTLTLGENNSLQSLYCYNNQLTKLDVSKCSALQMLYCYSNKLKTLTLGKNNSLWYIECYDNKLTEIDASGCPHLGYNIYTDDGVVIIRASSNSAESYSSQNADVQNHGGHRSVEFNTASLKVSSGDVVWQGTGRDEDLVRVRANTPVTFIIGEWINSDGTKANVSVENVRVFVDEKVVEGIEFSEEKIFILPAEFVHDDFKVSVKAKFAGNELESEELFISAEQ